MTAGTINWNNLGSTVPGTTGSTTLNALSTINFNGTSYLGATQIYTAGSTFNIDAGSGTNINANNSSIIFNTGTIQLASGTNLSINSNGGNVTLSPLLGNNLNLTVNANAFNYTQIGTQTQPLNTVNLTANSFSPIPPTNIFAESLIVNSSNPLLITTNVIQVGAITFNLPVQIGANNVTISNCIGGGADITFNSTLDADSASNTRNLTIDPCGHQVIFNGAVGGNAPLTSITIGPASNVAVNSTMNVGALTQTGGTGTTSFAAGITSTGSGGINLATNGITFQGTVVTGNGGGLTLNNSGTMTATSVGFNLSGAFDQIGAGAVNIGGTITTSNAAIQFTAPVTLANNLTITGGNIAFSNTIDGTKNLVLAAGSNNITFGGALGATTPLDDITINSAGNVTAGIINGDSLTQLAGSGTTTLNGAVDTAGVALTGNNIAVNNSITTTGTGTVTFINSGLLTLTSTHSIGGALTQSGSGSVSLTGQITSGGAISFASPVSLAGATTFNTSANNQNITFSNTLDGSNPLTLTLGSGNLTFGGNVGSNTSLGALLISSAGNVAALGVTATSITQTSASGTTTINGTLDTSGVSGIQLAGNAFNINGNLITTGNGSVSITNSGLLTLTGGASTSISGVFTQSGTGNVSLAGTLSTNSHTISFASPITIVGNTSLSTGTGANIAFASTINGRQNLTLAAGTGNISFGGNLGGTTPLGALTIQSVNNITYPIVNASSVSQVASSGTTTISGSLNTSGSAGISLVGTTINQNGVLSTLNSGPIVIQNSGTFTIVANTNASGPYTQSGSGTVDFGGSLLATNSHITFDGPIILTSAATFLSGPVGGDMTFANTIDGNQNLSLTAAGGSITFGASIGSTTPIGNLTIVSANNVSAQAIFAASITQSTGTGTSTFNGALTSTGDIDLSGNAFTISNNVATTTGSLNVANSGVFTLSSAANVNIAGSLNQTGVGTSNISGTTTTGGLISFVGPVTVTATASLNSSTNSQSISFLGTVDGPGNLTLAAQSANITFQHDIGDTTPLGALLVSSVNNLTIQAITASSITQAAGTGTTLFNSNVSTSGSAGINLTGSIFSFLANVTTTNSGPIAIANTGLLTLTPGKTVSASGSFTQTGSGQVSLGGSVLTNDAVLSFAGPITLSSAVSLNSSGGNLSIAQTIDGNEPLTLTAGAGNIVVLGNIGSTTPLASLVIVSGNNINFKSISAGSINQESGTGTTTLVGNIVTTGAEPD